MDNAGKISVIVPIYKAEACLVRCVNSILAQTYSNLEVVLVDDGSPDRSGAICEKYAAADSRVKVIHKENGGVSSARNAGIEVATGIWVMFVDSDDWLEPTYVANLVEHNMAGKCDLIIGGLQFTNGFSTSGRLAPENDVLPQRVFLSRFWKLFDIGLLSPVWGKLFRREKIMMSFPMEMRCGEDVFFNLVFLKNAENVALVHTDGYCYFAPSDCTQGTTKYKQRNVREYSLYIGSVRELLKLAPAEKQDRTRYEAFVFRSMCGDMKWISCSQPFRMAKKEIAQYLELPDVQQALEHKSWREMRMPFRLVGRFLRNRLFGTVVLSCKLAGRQYRKGNVKHEESRDHKPLLS